MSKLETNTIDTISGSTNLTLGGTNATDITIPSGVTITNNGTQSGFGGTNTPNFSTTLSSNQSISSTTWTVAQFNTEEFDSNSAFDTSTYTFTVPSGQAGKYSFIFNAYLADLGDLSRLNIAFRFNGSTDTGVNGYRQSASSLSSAYLQTQILRNLSVGDTVQAIVWHNQGSNQNLASSNSRFAGYKLVE